MKVTIDVKDRAQREAIEIAMDDPMIRAYVIVCGILKQLPTDAARSRVLTYAHGLINDPDWKARQRPDLRTAADLADPIDDEPDDRKVQ